MNRLSPRHRIPGTSRAFQGWLQGKSVSLAGWLEPAPRAWKIILAPSLMQLWTQQESWRISHNFSHSPSHHPHWLSLSFIERVFIGHLLCVKPLLVNITFWIQQIKQRSLQSLNKYFKRWIVKETSVLFYVYIESRGYRTLVLDGPEFKHTLFCDLG